MRPQLLVLSSRLPAWAPVATPGPLPCELQWPFCLSLAVGRGGACLAAVGSLPVPTLGWPPVGVGREPGVCWRVISAVWGPLPGKQVWPAPHHWEGGWGRCPAGASCHRPIPCPTPGHRTCVYPLLVVASCCLAVAQVGVPPTGCFPWAPRAPGPAPARACLAPCLTNNPKQHCYQLTFR